ncbi:recombinase family protein [Bradyrhizobium sp. ISRA463]|uniref:recombinase family protein n=1 Tax=unclassified Bradyrhizobium TaxID=2631580 RepID=UPI0032B0719D
MGVKSIAKHLNEASIRTRDGGRWDVDAVHKVLTRTTYVGRHRFNTKYWKTRERKPEAELVEMAVPPIIDMAEFEAVQTLLKTRSPAMTAPRIVSGPTLLTGIFCAACGGAMTLRTGKSGRYKYYTCSTKARQGETGCKGRTVPMEKLDSVVAEQIEQRLLQPTRLEEVLSAVLHRREERAERRTAQACGRGGSQAQAAVRRHRKRNRRRLRSAAQGSRDRAEVRPRPGPRRRRAGRGRARSSRTEHHTPDAQDLRQPGPQADADRVGRLPP